MATATDIRNDLSLNFKELYRTEQAKNSLPGPINIYGLTYTILFLRGCADHRACRFLCFTRFLQLHHNSVGFCYRLAELCSRFPSCQSKTRALTNIRTFLEPITNNCQADTPSKLSPRTILQASKIGPNEPSSSTAPFAPIDQIHVG